MATQRKVVYLAQTEAPQFRQVTWWKDRGLIKLYLCCAVVCLASATTGYDGSMLNVSVIATSLGDELCC
jgi:hypothetical protein